MEVLLRIVNAVNACFSSDHAMPHGPPPCNSWLAPSVHDGSACDNLPLMTKTQAQIVELIAQLPLAERRELFEHVQDAGLLEESLYSGMTPEQRAQLEEG